MASPHFRVLKYFRHLSLEPDVLQVSSDVGTKGGGEGKECDFACLHECVASCFGSWQEEEGGKESKIQKVFLVPVGSCSESPKSSTVNWGWGWVLGNKSCMRTICKRLLSHGVPPP